MRIAACRETSPESVPFRLLGFLHRGRPDESLRGPWDQWLAVCPEWIGLRSERCSSALHEELERESAELGADFLRGLEE